MSTNNSPGGDMLAVVNDQGEREFYLGEELKALLRGTGWHAEAGTRTATLPTEVTITSAATGETKILSFRNVNPWVEGARGVRGLNVQPSMNDPEYWIVFDGSIFEPAEAKRRIPRMLLDYTVSVGRE